MRIAHRRRPQRRRAQGPARRPGSPTRARRRRPRRARRRRGASTTRRCARTSAGGSSTAAPTAAIVVGGSGQGEVIACNKIHGIRAGPVPRPVHDARSPGATTTPTCSCSGRRWLDAGAGRGDLATLAATPVQGRRPPAPTRPDRRAGARRPVAGFSVPFDWGECMELRCPMKAARQCAGRTRHGGRQNSLRSRRTRRAGAACRRGRGSSATSPTRAR